MCIEILPEDILLTLKESVYQRNEVVCVASLNTQGQTEFKTFLSFGFKKVWLIKSWFLIVQEASLGT